MGQIRIIIISILLGATGQVLLKAGANRLGSLNITIDTFFQSIWKLITNPFIFIGMIFFALSSLLWIKVLTKSELSYAYPMVSMSYIIVGIASFVLFKESITINKIIGILTIVFGVFILNR